MVDLFSELGLVPALVVVVRARVIMQRVLTNPPTDLTTAVQSRASRYMITTRVLESTFSCQ